MMQKYRECFPGRGTKRPANPSFEAKPEPSKHQQVHPPKVKPERTSGFFDPRAGVTFFAASQPKGSVAIARQAWNIFSENDEFFTPPPLRAEFTLNRIELCPGDGLVYVSKVTGERLTHGERYLEIPSGMLRVYEENVRPQRPLDADAYQNFTAELRTECSRRTQRKATKIIQKTTPLNEDESSVVAAYYLP